MSGLWQAKWQEKDPFLMKAKYTLQLGYFAIHQFKKYPVSKTKL